MLGLGLGLNKFVNGVVGFALSSFQSLCSFFFDGVNDAINIDSTLEILKNDTIGTFLFSLYVPLGLPSHNGIIASFSDTSGSYFIDVNLFTSGKVQVRALTPGVFQFALTTDAQCFTDNSWNTIGIVQDGVEPRILINGIEVAQTFTATTNKTYWFNDFTQLDNGRLGCRSYFNQGNTIFFDGYINQANYYNTDLSDADILDWHNNGSPKDGSLISGCVDSWVPDNAYDFDSVNSEWAVPNGVNLPTIAKALELDGISKKLTIPNSDINSLVSGSNNFSIMASVKIDSLTGGSGFLGNTVTVNGRSTMTFFADSIGRVKVQTYLAGFPSMLTSASLSVNTEYVIWAVLDKTTPSNNRIYFNAVSKSLAVNSLTTFGSQTPSFAIGSIDPSANNQPLNGFVKSLAIVNRTITPTEVTDNYGGGNPLNPQTQFGTDCKYFFNSDNSIWGGASFTVEDSTNSITATSSNMVEADLKYRGLGVSYSQNMVELSKVTDNPYV